MPRPKDRALQLGRFPGLKNRSQRVEAMALIHAGEVASLVLSCEHRAVKPAAEYQESALKCRRACLSHAAQEQEAQLV